MLKAILFDLDDTLIDWSFFEADWERIESKHLNALHAHLTETIKPFCEVEAFRKEFSRRTRSAWSDARSTLDAPHLGRILVQTVLSFGLLESDIDERDCLEAYQWGAVEGTYPFPDVVDALINLRERGIRTGIVTNAFQPMWLRDVELEEHGLLEFFPECRFSAADVGRLKPDRKIFEAALNCLKLKPEEVVFIGDNLTADIGGAQRVGMKAILRTHRAGSRPYNDRFTPDASIHTFEKLPAILDAWYPGWDNGQAHG